MYRFFDRVEQLTEKLWISNNLKDHAGVVMFVFLV